jgi:hypothetical protein
MIHAIAQTSATARAIVSQPESIIDRESTMPPALAGIHFQRFGQNFISGELFPMDLLQSV